MYSLKGRDPRTLIVHALSFWNHIREGKRLVWFLRSQLRSHWSQALEIPSVLHESQASIFLSLSTAPRSRGNSKRDKLLLLLQLRLCLGSLRHFLNEPISQVGNDAVFFAPQSSCHRSDNSQGDPMRLQWRTPQWTCQLPGKLQGMVIATACRDSIRKVLNFQRWGNSPAAKLGVFSIAVHTKISERITPLSWHSQLQHKHLPLWQVQNVHFFFL